MRYPFLALALAALASAAPTHVVGTLRAAADATPINGYVLITYPTFTAADSSVYPAHTTRLQIVAGNFDALLEPGTYTLAWGNVGEPEWRTLTVPASSAAVPLAACLTTTPAAVTQQFTLSQISPSGATIGQVIAFTSTGWAPASVAGAGALPISAVTGLQSALDVRPIAGPAYAAGHAAVIDTTGAIDAATGAAGDCVHTDGSTGPCGDAGTAAALASETTTRATADTAEITARAAGDAASATALASEASARAAGDTASAAAIAAETAARIAGGGGGGGGGSYTAAFTAATVVNISGPTHGLGTADLSISCRDAAGNRYDASTVIDPATYGVTITHAEPQTGRCVLQR